MNPTTLNNPVFTGGAPMGASDPSQVWATLLSVLKGLGGGQPGMPGFPGTGAAPMPPQQGMPGFPGTGTPGYTAPIVPPTLAPPVNPAIPTQLGTAPNAADTTTLQGGSPSFSMPDMSGFDYGAPGMFLARQAANIVNPLGGIMHGLQAADQWWKGAPPADAAPVAPTDELSSMFPTAPYTAPVDPDADVALKVPFDIDTLPKPPVYGAPPQVDMERVQRSARNSVLGGLSKGAASVDPTEAGSFARALAAAGGGGAEAAAESGNKQAEIAYQNALNEYNVSMKNKQAEFEQEGKKWELTQPTMKATDDSIIVQEYDKDQKAYKTRVIKTDGILGDSKKLKDTIEAMGGSGPAAESMEVNYIAKTLGSDPGALQGTLKRVAIERTLDNGAGQAVFGDKFVQAQKQANDKLLSSGSVSNDPEKTRKALNKEISSILLSDPELMSSDWLTPASQYGSIAATILKDGQK